MKQMDSSLQVIGKEKNTTLYEVLPSEGIEVVIASNPLVSQLLINPQICGLQFQQTLSSGLTAIIEALKEFGSSGVTEALGIAPLDVLYILRGGLNFDLHRSLTMVTGKLPEVSFISSQRVEAPHGFDVGESGYHKWSIQDESLLCIGDISATATTFRHALDSAVIEYQRQRKEPRWLLILTIGTSRIREMLGTYISTLKTSWTSRFQGATVVYLEEVFSLYVGNSLLASTHLPYTDFFRKDHPSAIEFEAASLETAVCYLERCAIYDGGSRAFEPKVYLNNLREYWIARVREEDHLDVITLLRLKSNLLDYQLDFARWLEKRPWWDSINHDELRRLHGRGQEELAALLARSIRDISEERLTTINERIGIYYGGLH